MALDYGVPEEALKFANRELRKAIQRERKELAKEMHKIIFPTSTLSCMSGHSEMLEKFITLAKLIQEGKLK